MIRTEIKMERGKVVSKKGWGKGQRLGLFNSFFVLFEGLGLFLMAFLIKAHRNYTIYTEFKTKKFLFVFA